MLNEMCVGVTMYESTVRVYKYRMHLRKWRSVINDHDNDSEGNGLWCVFCIRRDYGMNNRQFEVLVAVSYTHLDVYKRQSHTSPS